MQYLLLYNGSLNYSEPLIASFFSQSITTILAVVPVISRKYAQQLFGSKLIKVRLKKLPPSDRKTATKVPGSKRFKKLQAQPLQRCLSD